jgi:hypothetical protein
MDFLDPQKKREQAIRLMVGYILIGIAIALASFVLLLETYGFDINRKTGQVIQNGLVFVASHPVSANLYLNGQLKGTTSTKLTIPAGHYTVVLKRDGFRSWQRSFDLQGGTVKQLVYPVLFPTKLVTSDLMQYSLTPGFVSESPDRHWLLVQQPGAITSFDSFDLSNPTLPPLVLSLPSTLLSVSTGSDSLKLIEWSTDNRHVLVEHTFTSGTEYLVIDRQDPTASYNVNKQFNVNPSSVALHNKRFDQLYIYDAINKTLQSADNSTGQLTTLINNVIAYKAYGANTILYATTDSQTPSKNAIRLWDGKYSYLLHYYPNSTNYLLDMAAYGSHTYAVVAPIGSSEVYIYKDPLAQAQQTPSITPTPFTSLKITQPAFVSFSSNTQFIMAQSGSSFAVYDNDTGDRHLFTLKDTLPSTQQAAWMDGNRIIVVVNSKAVVLDFDGTNEQTLSALADGTLPYFDQSYTSLYALAPSTQPTRTALTRTLLTLK